MEIACDGDEAHAPPGPAGPGVDHRPPADGGAGPARPPVGLRILWELRDGPLGARALLAASKACRRASSYERLRELPDAGLVEQDDDDAYRLTDVGESLGAALQPLDGWARTGHGASVDEAS